MLTYKMAIALRPQICDVTSPYIYGNLWYKSLPPLDTPLTVVTAARYDNIPQLTWTVRSINIRDMKLVVLCWWADSPSPTTRERWSCVNASLTVAAVGSWLLWLVILHALLAVAAVMSSFFNERNNANIMDEIFGRPVLSERVLHGNLLNSLLQQGVF